MADADLALTRHRLAHFPALKVKRDFLGMKFERGCVVNQCDAACCRYGVYADLGERENILAHRETILRHLEPHQEHDPERWFEERIFDDGDFPSGKAVGTQARDYGCVFLDRAGKCALQKAAIAEGMDPLTLKPFYCYAYPVVIEAGVLMIDDSQHVNNPQCCQASAGGEQDVLDVCAWELEFMLGADGLAELRELSAAVNIPEPPSAM